MKNIVLTVTYVCILGLLVFWPGMNDVSAQGSSRITVSPLNFELTANPGDTVTNTVRISNPGSSVITIRMEVEDFTVVGETGRVVVEPAETETYSLAGWVEVLPDLFTLQPGEQQAVEFSIKVPFNAEPGGHYGSILASTIAVTGEGFTGAAIAQKVGSLVLLSVSGDVIEELNVKEFTAPGFLEFGPIPFVIRFENEGTIHVRPRGFVTITNWRGKKVVDLEFPQKNVLPDSTRRIEVTWDTKWLLGKYTATIVGSYGSSNNPITPWVLTFWVIPWKLLIGVTIVSLIVLLILFLTRRRWGIALKILFRGERSVYR